MKDEDLAAAWLERVHGIRLEAGSLSGPWSVAGRLAAVARDAAAGLPFGTEPAGFYRRFEALAEGSDADDR